MTQEVNLRWAVEEFGHAQLGDKRRTKRLVAVAADVVATPAGKLTQVWEQGAEREGAYRFMENEAVDPAAMSLAASVAALRRAPKSARYLVVAEDFTTLSLMSALKKGAEAGFGPVGTQGVKSQGLECAQAILLSPQGEPLGVGGQSLWAREPRQEGKQDQGKSSKAEALRPLEERETVHWVIAAEQALKARELAGYKGHLWFQFDRGGDSRDILHWASMVDGAWVTVRVAQDRCVDWPQEGLLWEVVGAEKVLGTYTLKVAGGPKRQARRATLEVRATSVVLPLPQHWTKREQPVELFAVHAVEVGTVPAGEEPIEWMLLTTRRVRGFKGARRVLKAYALRWRAEEVFKTWKSVVQVQASQLMQADNFARWATVLVSVAVRLERLKYLARTAPETPADTELTPAEIRALQLKYDPQALQRGEQPTIAQAVTWIAYLGGYSKYAKRPPGTIVLGRGLKKLAAYVEVLELATELLPKEKM